MNRTGFEKNEMNRVVAFLKKKKEHVVLKDFAPIMPVLKA
jgi:alanine racemase